MKTWIPPNGRCLRCLHKIPARMVTCDAFGRTTGTNCRIVVTREATGRWSYCVRERRKAKMIKGGGIAHIRNSYKFIWGTCYSSHLLQQDDHDNHFAAIVPSQGFKSVSLTPSSVGSDSCITKIKYAWCWGADDFSPFWENVQPSTCSYM
jgi:hypothetical protein